MGNRRTVDHISAGSLATGSDLLLAVHVCHGQQPGPRLGLVATLHGNETIGMQVISELLQGLADENWRGGIVAIPVANPLAFEALTRNTPLDMLNLNRVFPGVTGGWITEQLADVIWTRLRGNVDVVIDLHGADAFSVNDFIFLPEEKSEAHVRARDLAMAFGQEWVYEAPDISGSLAACALAAGIPAILPELGTDMWRAQAFVGKGVRGIRNVMRRLGMLAGSVEVPTRQCIIRDRMTLRAHHGGLFLPMYGMEALGAEIGGGTRLARIVDSQTFDEREVLEAPYGRNLIMLARGRSRIHPGDYCYHCGDMETARWHVPQVA